MKNTYYISADNHGDGKSVCLWAIKHGTNIHYKVARFQSDSAARKFAQDFDFPLSKQLLKRLRGEK
jgi:hypothetical protein